MKSTQARINSALTLRTSLARHVRNHLRDLKRDDKRLASAEEAFRPVFEAGDSEGVTKAILGQEDAIGKEVHDSAELMTDAEVLMNRIKNEFRLEIRQAIFVIQNMITHHIVQDMMNSDDPKLKRIASKMREHLLYISSIFRTEETEIKGVLDHIANVSADIDNALFTILEEIKKGEVVGDIAVRLRTQVARIAAETQASFDALLLKRTQRKTHRDAKKTHKALTGIIKIVEHEPNKIMTVEHVQVLAKKIEKAVLEAKKYGKDLHALFEDSRLIILIATKHALYAIGDNKIALEQLHELKEDNFPINDFRELYNKVLKEVAEERNEALDEKHLAFQFAHGEFSLHSEIKKLENETSKL